MPAADRDSTAATAKANKAQLEAQLEVDDLHWLMGDVRGRRFMWRLLKRSHIYDTSYTGEALSMSFKEGERNVGLGAMAEILKHCPNRLSEMQTEARKHERRIESKTS